MKHRMATGHNAMLAPVANWDLSTLAGAGVLRSSANDMLMFLGAFLDHRESPLAPVMKAMLEVRRPVGKTGFEIRLGWNILGEIVWHDGGTGGFRSFIGYDPKARVGVVALSNVFALSGVDDIAIHLLNPKAPLANFDPPKQHAEIPLDPGSWITTRGGINCRTAFSKSCATATASSHRSLPSAGSPSPGLRLKYLPRASVSSS